MTPNTDEHFMRRALHLARQGIGLASPNPHVGAVIVDRHGAVAGTGVYTYADKKHAEILALEEAGEQARGATLYINLEPHSYHGRTPPCTDALITAGVRRVVASMADPNPRVSGKGFEQLRAAGVEVQVGLLEREAHKLNEAFAQYTRHRLPLVTLKAAMTLNGKIAAPQRAEERRIPGIPAGGWITGEAARAHVQRQRHESDAILAGIGTILADDPLLTDRSGRRRRRPLLRVILDSQLRLPVQSRLAQSVSTGQADVLVFHSSRDEKKKNELQSLGILLEQLPSAVDGRLDLNAVLSRLGQLDVTSLLIEGGSAINAAALASGIVDKLFLYYAPRIVGDAGAVAFVNSEMFNATRPLPPPLRDIHLHRFAEDIAIEGYLRDPYRE